MSIDNNDFSPKEFFVNTGTPIIMGVIPTAMIGLAKAPMTSWLKITSMTISTLAILILGGLKSVPHEHPKEFCDPITGKPFEKGDTIIHNGETRAVVGYTGHHDTIFKKNTVKQETANHEVHMRQQPLWTGPYDLVAKNYGSGKHKKVGLVLAKNDNSDQLYKHDVSGDGSFQSFDASKAVAISPKGQEIHDITIHNPKTLGVEHKPGLAGDVGRAVQAFKSEGIKKGIQTHLDTKTISTLSKMTKHFKKDHS